MVETPSSPRAASGILRWALILVAVLPFQLGLWHHLVTAGSSATGFLGYDSAYYAANGREVFEHGNGFAYSNPYDPDPAAPVIYFHWFSWVLGFGIKVLHLDPGLLYAGLGVITALVGSALTLRLVEIMLPDPRGRNALFLLTMWGGGALCLGAMIKSLAAGLPAGSNLFAFDEAYGWWMPNWGRNFCLANEAVYHVVVAATWIAVLRGRGTLALVGAGALAATHPFSGAQHLAIVGAWLGFLAWRERSPTAIARAGAAGLLLALFAGYYFWFLNQFPAHRELQTSWVLGWRVSWPFLLLSTGPVVLLALLQLRAVQWRLTDRERFLLLAGGLTLLLMKHDWFIAPRQPLHFVRGYNWLPFWLIALPLLQSWGAKLTARPRPALVALTVLGTALLVSDNAEFITREWAEGESANHHLDREQREMFAWMDAAKLDGVLLCADPHLSYLSATYTGVRPYYGHIANTPNVQRRWREVSAWQQSGATGPWIDSINYVLIERQHPPAGFNAALWHELHGNGGYVLLGRGP